MPKELAVQRGHCTDGLRKGATSRIRARCKGFWPKPNAKKRTSSVLVNASARSFCILSDGKQKAERQVKPQPWGKHKGNGETLPPVVGKHGAAAALERLERQEETAYRRLQVALEGGDRFQVQAAQDFWLKCSETLRRLDLAVEVARRSEETQIPLRQAESVVLAVADWLRIAFMQFLSAEVRALMGIKDVGEWKFYAFGRFKGILDLTVAGSLKSRSPIPDWAEPFVRLRLSSKSSLKTVRARHSV